MPIPALGVGTGQAVQDRSLGMFKIGKAQDGLGLLAIDSGARLLLHGLWPPCHQTMIRRPALQFCPVCPSFARNHVLDPKNLALRLQGPNLCLRSMSHFTHAFCTYIVAVP